MSQQQSPPHSAALLQLVPPLAALPLMPLDEATADETVDVLATELTELEATDELEATEELEATDELELPVGPLNVEPPAPPAPPTPVSMSVEPVAQLITMPKPTANAPMP
jgi:hypothetical protein